MKLEKFKTESPKKKAMIIGSIILVLLVTIVVVYRSFAFFEENQEFNVIKGSVPNYSGYGASQISGGAPGSATSQYDTNRSIMTGTFGSGGYGLNSSNGLPMASGGGGGYYGGGHGVHTSNSYTGGGGGSSFISGYTGCNAIDEISTATNIIHTEQPNHYSGYIFNDSEMIAGNSSMPTHDGTGSMIGNTGNGYAKITFVLY